MEIAIYETYDYHTKAFYWWTGRDRSTNCFEIRKSVSKYKLIVNDNLASDCSDFNAAIEKLKSMYNNGDKEKIFRILRT